MIRLYEVNTKVCKLHDNFQNIFLGILFIIVFFSSMLFPNNDNQKKILILVEGNTEIATIPIATGRQLNNLLGHFHTSITLKGVNQYNTSEINSYDFVFYIGDKFRNNVPQIFLSDIINTSKQVVWINTGFIEFSKNFDTKKYFGFYVSNVDSTSNYDAVKSGDKYFTKEDPTVEAIQIVDKKMVKVLATVYSSKLKKESPYIVKSKNLIYIADSPFAYANETDRYLLFADMLHDILGENHEESHSAIIRIEDISPMDNADKLRAIADLLSQKGIPFLVSVIPFYVNPETNTRVSLSDKPELVDALKYMVKNGASIVMHGSTHQYKGITASDFEFWDAVTNKPIKNEKEEAFSAKIENGIHELIKNGLYPVLWETPHYTGSQLFYKTISKYFTTAMEPRLVIDDFDQSQYFPYVIHRDNFGQKIYPENLGYVPLDEDKEVSRQAVLNILKGAKANLQVRDGFAACFFHEFIDIEFLEQIVNGITALGYTYIDLKEYVNKVQLKDRVILTGSQDYNITLDNQYLVESVFDKDGELKQKYYSNERLNGTIKKSVKLLEGEIYFAEPAEFKEQKLTFWEDLKNKTGKFVRSVFEPKKTKKIARPVILWNHYALGGKYNDQASFVSAFKSININVDTIFVGQNIDLSKYNLVIIPSAVVDSLSDVNMNMISEYVKNGGNVILDSRSSIAEMFNIKFLDSKLKVWKIRDKYFPEEQIAWRYSELVSKFEMDYSDEIFCSDEITKMPMVIGKAVNKGKVIYINSLFDPYSTNGCSMYPYLLEYVKDYFNLYPIVRRNNLEVFFDPGFRSAYSLENLVKQWVSQGIQIIHAAGWHIYPKYTFDYKRLIELAHANGILVYAWLEPPQVSQKFWNEHPEWREKNYLNQDVRPSWRYPVALTNSQCLSTVTNELVSFLDKYDWDGVNLAELYFEAGIGFTEPNLFTPMNSSAVSDVQKQYGIPLLKIFDHASEYYWKNNSFVHKSIVEYRVNKLSMIYEKLLSAFNSITQKNKGFDIIVTAMDSYGSPELKENIAVDMDKILELQKKFNFRLQVEDPQNRWSTDPLRYRQIGNLYASKVGAKEKIALDLNIMKFREEKDVTPFPTLIQTGIESYQLINAASLGAPRYTLYSESTINLQDFSFLPFAAASEVEYHFTKNGITLNSPHSFSLQLPEEIKFIHLDGYPIAASRNNAFVIPAGMHTVELTKEPLTSFSTYELQVKILSFTGNLKSVAYGLKDIKVAYESDMRTIISLNAIPTSVKVDDNDYPITVMKGTDCYSIFLPPGSHYAVITAGEVFSYGINLTSLWSSQGIAIFGTVAVILLAFMLVYLKIIKRKFSSK